MRNIENLLDIDAYLEEFLSEEGYDSQYFLYDEEEGVVLDIYNFHWKEAENGYISGNFYISKDELEFLQKAFLEKVRH